MANFKHKNRELPIFKPTDQTVIPHTVANQTFQFAYQSFTKYSRVMRREQLHEEKFENSLLRRSIQIRQLLLRFDEKTHFPGQGIV